MPKFSLLVITIKQLGFLTPPIDKNKNRISKVDKIFWFNNFPSKKMQHIYISLTLKKVWAMALFEHIFWSIYFFIQKMRRKNHFAIIAISY